MNKFLGLDPSVNNTGWGFIQFDLTGVITWRSGVIHAVADWPRPDKLAHMHRELILGLDRFQPDFVAIERQHGGKNIGAGLALAGIQDVLSACVALTNTPQRFYSPSTMKLAVTGYGRASKGNVAATMASHLKYEGEIQQDQADALGMAWTAYKELSLPVLIGAPALEEKHVRREH